jgi:DNA-binding NarL/FixJ family response regulator
MADAQPLTAGLIMSPGSSGRQRIRILIVEDHQLVADALEALLNQQPDMLVVGNVGSVADSAPRAMELCPDVVIMDFRLNDGTGADAAEAIWQAGCEASFIFLTRDESDAARLAAIEAGASAVLYKAKAAVELINAVRTVADGGTLIPRGTVAVLFNKGREMDGQRDSLTTREREILSLMADGTASREIATRLGISYLTVRSHIRSVAGKLSAHSKMEAVVRARELALIN